MDNIKNQAYSQEQLENWNNFCQYHAVGDWHGVWTRYTQKVEVIESFKCIRSFHKNNDCSEIKHENHYIYPNGKTETKKFGPYNKPATRALYLSNSFSWGVNKINLGVSAFFETGFRYEDKRASVVVIYNERGSLEEIIVIPEHLSKFIEQYYPIQVFSIESKWLGTLITMTPEWIVSSPVESSWLPPEDLGANYLVLRFPENITVICPQKIENEQKFLLAVDWLANSNFLQRGIRYYDASGFLNFTLQSFVKSHE